MSVEVEVGGVYEPAADLTPTGAIIAFGGSTAPNGWFMCDGSAKNRITESNLFDVIETTFGTGDGSDTFNLPDLKGVFLRGAGSHDSMTKADGNAFDGGAVGDENNDTLQGHEHEYYRDKRQTPASDDLQSSNVDFGARAFTTVAMKEKAPYGPPREGAETTPANIAVNYIIKN